MRAESTKRSARFYFRLSPRRALVDADVIVLGSATSIDPAGLQQVLDAVEPDGYVVKVLADHPTIGAIAVRRTVLSATWLQHLVEAVTGSLDGIMAPDLLWVGSVSIEIEAQTVVEGPDVYNDD